MQTHTVMVALRGPLGLEFVVGRLASAPHAFGAPQLPSEG